MAATEQTRGTAGTETAPGEGRGDGWTWWVWGACGVASAALILYLNRGTIFRNDELIWFSDLGGGTSIIDPHNGHLHGTIRSIFWLTAELFDADYRVIRVLGAGAVLLASALLFAFAKRRIDARLALVPAVILLFYGSAWHHVVSPIGFTVVFGVAYGLAAFLGLDYQSRRGDVLACLALCLGLFTFSSALGFLVGAAVWIALRDDRLQRAWVVAIPAALYATWRIWAARFDEGRTDLSNILDVPAAVAESLAIDTGAITGFNPLLQSSEEAIGRLPPSLVGWLLAAGLLAAFVLRVRRGSVPPALWAAAAVPLTYWSALAVGADPFELFTPTDSVRYVYPGTVGVLLVGIELARGTRVPRWAWVAVAAIAVFSLAVNVDRLREGGATVRAQAGTLSAKLAAYELAVGLSPGSGPGSLAGGATAIIGPSLGSDLPRPDTEDYFRAISIYGSPARTLPELRASGPAVRRAVDLFSLEALGVGAEPSSAPAKRSGCLPVRTSDGQPANFTLPPGGALILNQGTSPSEIGLRRLGDTPGPSIGTADPSEWTEVSIREDALNDAWHATLPGTSRVLVCPRA